MAPQTPQKVLGAQTLHPKHLRRYLEPENGILNTSEGTWNPNIAPQTPQKVLGARKWHSKHLRRYLEPWGLCTYMIFPCIVQVTGTQSPKQAGHPISNSVFLIQHVSLSHVDDILKQHPTMSCPNTVYLDQVR